MVYLLHVYWNIRVLLFTMSSDRQKRAARRNLAAKHAHRFNKSYAINPKTSYNRKSKAHRRDLNDTLVRDAENY